MNHFPFWWCVKSTFVLGVGIASAAFLVWGLLAIGSAAVEAHQERSVRRRRQSYSVGAVISPQSYQQEMKR